MEEQKSLGETLKEHESFKFEKKEIIYDAYTQRLIDEWRQHGKIIIASDFDDTISPWKLNNQERCNEIMKILTIAKEVGAYIVVFTACNKDRYPEIEKYCESHGLKIDSINQNPIDLPYGNQNKIYANIFIDDRSGINEALMTLQQALYQIRSEQHSPTNQSVEF